MCCEGLLVVSEDRFEQAKAAYRGRHAGADETAVEAETGLFGRLDRWWARVTGPFESVVDFVDEAPGWLRWPARIVAAWWSWWLLATGADRVGVPSWAPAVAIGVLLFSPGLFGGLAGTGTKKKGGGFGLAGGLVVAGVAVFGLVSMAGTGPLVADPRTGGRIIERAPSDGEQGGRLPSLPTVPPRSEPSTQTLTGDDQVRELIARMGSNTDLDQICAALRYGRIDLRASARHRLAELGVQSC